MRESIRLYAPGTYSYPMSGRFVPNLVPYLHTKDGTLRPAMIVVPGGGYAMVSPTEGEIVAERFFEAGFQCFVLTYTTNLLQVQPVQRQALEDISRAVRLVRSRAKAYHVDPGKIACCGFSAGAHVVASLAVHGKEQAPETEETREVSNRPDAVILSYPVITSGVYAHRDSFRLLLGEHPTEEALDWASLEKHVTKDCPPAFLWQTLDDELVPVENSILYARACREAGVPCELHLFRSGKHGLSLANARWARGDFGEDADYTVEQTWQTMKVLSKENPGAIPAIFAKAAAADSAKDFNREFGLAIAGGKLPENQPVPAVAKWPDLALAFLEAVL